MERGEEVSMNEYIIRMLEYANEREINLIYRFILRLIDWNRIPEPKYGEPLQ